jgi:hypothetical protein
LTVTDDENDGVVDDVGVTSASEDDVEEVAAPLE